MQRRWRPLAALLFLLVLLLAGGIWWIGRSGMPRREGSAAVHGLAAPVTIRYDRFGMPHVRAASLSDLALALGYVHANDRLLQMELGRRLTSGRLAELVGDVALASDVHYRSLGFRRWAERQLDALGDESRAALSAYAAGVNAWLAERGSDLPPEFWLLGAAPEPWQPIDSIYFQLAMAHELSFWQGRPEEDRFLWLRAVGRDGLEDLLGGAPLIVPEATAALAAAGGAPTAGRPDRRAEVLAGASALLAGPLQLGSVAPGSNNWAVGPSRTATGHAIVANDPHLPLRLPGFWYQAQLRSPEYEASGMTLVGLPFVVIGQGPSVAWALTNVMLDDHDLFIEQLDDSGRAVRRGDGWLPLETVTETIRVAGGAARELRVRYTDIGVLLEADPQRGLPPRSLAWTGAIASDPAAVFLRIARARRVRELVGKLEEYVAPAQNLVAADRDGDLLYTAIGRVPRRRRGDGRLPAPAWDASYGWDRLMPQRDNPTLLQPADELLVTANHDIRPTGYNPPVPFTAEFDTRHRAERIRELLAARSDWTPPAMAAVQTDVRSLYALELVRLLRRAVHSPPPAAERALATLEGWDGTMARTGPAALFALVERRLGALLFDDDRDRYGLPVAGGRRLLLRALRGELGPQWIDDRRTERREGIEEIAAAALQSAYQEAVARWGPDPAAFAYGALHPLTFESPLGRLPLLRRWLNRGPIPMPGSATTVAAFGGRWRGRLLPVVYGPSMRWLADPADPDATLAVLPLGQSGHPADPHYDDQLPLYLAGRLRRVAWSEGAIAAATVATLSLRPEPRAPSR